MRLLTAVLILAALPAQAESPRRAMFPSDGSCYLRQYSRDHLAKHPDQLVTQIAIGPANGQAEADVLILHVAVYVRGSDEQYRGNAWCENTGGSLSCNLEGDGGWFSLSPGNKGALDMKVGRAPLGFEGSSGFITFGADASDDDSFVIPKVPADACP